MLTENAREMNEFSTVPVRNEYVIELLQKNVKNATNGFVNSMSIQFSF